MFLGTSIVHGARIPASSEGRSRPGVRRRPGTRARAGSPQPPGGSGADGRAQAKARTKSPAVPASAVETEVQAALAALGRAGRSGWTWLREHVPDAFGS